MSERRYSHLPFTGPPSRVPGESQVELEPVAGDIQLTGLRRPGTKRPQQLPQDVYRPHDVVPVSGVYDLVDEAGNYLRSQVTCHAGTHFPPTQSHVAREVDGAAAMGGPHAHYAYRLAYEAEHLQLPHKRDETVHAPGEKVRVSGVYNVVGLDGGYLQHQRACVEGEEFPVSKVHEPGAYGYKLEYEAERLGRD